MHARITRVQIAAGKIEEARARVKDLLPEIKSVPGLKEFVNVLRDDGGGVVIALYNSKADLDASTPRVKEIWGGLADLLSAAPDSEEYEVENRELID